MEETYGIREYLHGTEFTGGILKHFISDFVVNEIDLEGNVVHLTNEEFIPPEGPTQEQIFSEQDIESYLKTLSAVLDQGSLDKLLHLLNEKASGNTDLVVGLDCPESKAARKVIHSALKGIPGILSSTDPDTATIKVFFESTAKSFKKRKEHKLDDRSKKKPPHKYIQFVLWKKNVDTMKAVKLVAKYIRANEKFFGVAGNKDKRGITTQRVTCYSTNLARLRNTTFPNHIQIGDFKYSDSSLSIGHLQGNKFTMIIRNIAKVPSETSVNLLNTQGFINYFGLQRFGNSNANPTHLVGLAILNQDYEKAVNMVLSARTGSYAPEEAARAAWVANKDIEEALSLFPPNSVRPTQYIERSILSGMAKGGGNTAFYNGIMSLPRNSRNIYGHAYQSYVWNKVASVRVVLSRSICKSYIVVGDLVLEGSQPVEITETNIQDYSFDDLVLPLPGTRVVFPENLRDCYTQLLAEDGISLEHFNELVK